MKTRSCFYCGQPLEDKDFDGFHRHCALKMFPKGVVPTIDLDDDILLKLAEKSVGQGKTIPGVQKKLSLHLSKGKDKRSWRFTLLGYPLGYILKPPSSEYPNLPESEALVMELAEEAGLDVVPHSLIPLPRGGLAYLTKRIDRFDDGKGNWGKIPMEDFCQLDEKPTSEKYRGSYEKVGRIIDRYSERPVFDKSELFLRLVFCFLSGNSDMHLKNFSLIKNPQIGEVLSPAYDLLPTNILLKEDKEETALTLNGKKKNLRRKDFLILAQSLGIAEALANRLIERMLTNEGLFYERTASSFMNEEGKKDFTALFESRFAILKK